MQLLRRFPLRRPNLSHYLEFNWSRPAYSGGLLLVLGLCFFGAATNTMVGWLYVMSGLIFALLVLGAILPPRSLRSLQVQRPSQRPITVGDELRLELAITNPTRQALTLLQVREVIPDVFGPAVGHAIAAIAPGQTHHCTTTYPGTQRGIYHWSGVELRTAAPLGLFWASRRRTVPARVVIYPRVLPLRRCDLIDTLIQEQALVTQRDRQYRNATEGITKTLRPYRTGDPTRLIHWRSSARFDQFQVRELEVLTSGREVIIALHSGTLWPDAAQFEDAVTAAASLYFYASRCQLGTQLWTAESGLVKGNQVVLEALARVQIQPRSLTKLHSNHPVVWLTPTLAGLGQLPLGSHYLYFGSEMPRSPQELRGMQITPDQPLADQLNGSQLR